MDRKISTEFAKQRRNKKIIKIVMSVVVSITIFIVIINLTKPSINLEDVKISTATRDNLYLLQQEVKLFLSIKRLLHHLSLQK